MKKITVVFAALLMVMCCVSCGWDVKDPYDADEPDTPVTPDPTPGGNDFPEQKDAEISVKITSPGEPDPIDNVTPQDKNIHVAGYGCEGNVHFKWQRGDVLYAVNQRTGEVTEIVTQEDDVLTALFTGYVYKGVRKDDEYLIYNKTALRPADYDRSMATGSLRFQAGPAEELKRFSAMGGTANALAYDEQRGVSLTETKLEHKMAFLHIRAIVGDDDRNADYAAMSLFAETTSNEQQMKALGSTCFSKYYNLRYDGDVIDVYPDETKDCDSYIRCTFSKSRKPTACTQQMIKDDPRANGKHYVDCFMAINPKNQYKDESNGRLPVENYVVNLYSCSEAIYNKHLRMADILKKLEAGKIICMNVDMSDPDNTDRTDAITVPGFYFSLSPGYVCGHRQSLYDEWEYQFTGMWNDVDPSVRGVNQAIIRGQRAMNELYNEFFVWGGTTPEELYYEWTDGTYSGIHNFKTIYEQNFVDVARLCDDGYWRSFNGNELDSIAHLLSNKSSYTGYYESKEIDPRDGSRKTYHVYGLYIGTNSQPRYEDQNKYFFFPSSIDIYDDVMPSSFTVRYRTSNGYEDRTFYIGTPGAIKRYDYNHRINGTEVVTKFNVIPDENLVGNRAYVSIWSGADGGVSGSDARTAYRIVFDGGVIRIGNFSKGLGRFIRGVRY